MKATRAVMLAGILGAVTVLAPAARAQMKPGGIVIGPWLGLNFATFAATNVPNVTWSTRTGITLGAQIERVLSPTIFLRVGGFYSQRGSQFDGGGGGTGSIKLSGIEFPVVLGYRFTSHSSPITPYVVVGGQVAFKTGCSAESNGGSEDCNSALGSNVSGTDLGVTFGAGFGYRLHQATVMVDVRYLLGLTNGISSATTSSTLKNRGITVAAGYMVPFGAK
jgi:Outer membrane protein beta-barrel domain